MASLTEQDIFSIPSIAQQTLERIAALGDGFTPYLHSQVAYVGCGSSYCIALAAATLHEETTGAAAHAIMASEFRPRRDWQTIAISRTGQTTELIEAMRLARQSGGQVALIGGDSGSPAAAHANYLLPLEFAPEEGVIQTRFILAALIALRGLIGSMAMQQDLAELPERLATGLTEFDPDPLLGFDRYVFLGRGWRYGLAMSAALNAQETALFPPDGHQTMEYRHGPIAGASRNTLVWCFDPEDDISSAAVLAQAQKTGATVRATSGDPLVALAQAQLVAVRNATLRGIDSDAPRNLSRAIILPTSELPIA